MKFKIALLISVTLLSACGDNVDDSDVVGPEDYVHFSEYFTMDEAVTNEMAMDGGTPMVDPQKTDPYAAILTAKALPGDTTAETLTSSPGSTASVELIQ